MQRGLFRIEFSNLLATQVRSKALTLAEAISLLNDAASLVATVIDVPHVDALRTAQSFSVSAYDARFLAAAQALGTKLITEDSRLRKAAPKLTQSDLAPFGALLGHARKTLSL